MTVEGTYWNGLYQSGGISGKGSVGAYRRWKWKVIKGYVDVKDRSVLDVGCGDLSFLRGKKFRDYLGVDISPFIIERNRKERPDLTFLIGDVTERESIIHGSSFDMVLCMDILFHIMSDEGFENLLSNLNRWVGEWLFLNTWCKNPLPYRNDDYQYFRNLADWSDSLPALTLVATHQKRNDPWNMIYVFTRKEG